MYAIRNNIYMNVTTSSEKRDHEFYWDKGKVYGEVSREERKGRKEITSKVKKYDCSSPTLFLIEIFVFLYYLAIMWRSCCLIHKYYLNPFKSDQS